MFTVVVLGVGVGVVGSTQLSQAIKSGSLDLQDSRLGRLLTSFSEPATQAAAPAGAAPAGAGAPAADPAAVAVEERRPAVFRQVLRAAAPPPPLAEDCAAPVTTDSGAVIGDRIRLRFFERSLLGGEGASADVAEVAYERLDLSGMFDVGAEGDISLPLAGRIGVAGMTLPCIEQLAALRMYAAAKTAPQVSASFEGRPAITVRGAVRAPGSYQPGPGATVERMLALAGSAGDGGVQDAQAFLTLLARKAEYDRGDLGLLLREKRARALLGRARVLGLDGEQVKQVETLLGADRLAVEDAALMAEIDMIEAQDAELAAQKADLAVLETETGAMLRKVQAQYEDLSRRRDDLLKLKERGVASAVQLDGISFNVISVEREMLDLQKSLLQSRASANALGQTAIIRGKDRARTLSAELRSVAEDREKLAAARQMLEVELSMYEGGVTPSGNGLRLSVRIARIGPTGSESFAAAADTVVLPGDVITVTASLPSFIGQMPADAAADMPADMPGLMMSDREIE